MRSKGGFQQQPRSSALLLKDILHGRGEGSQCEEEVSKEARSQDADTWEKVGSFCTHCQHPGQGNCDGCC